MVPVGGRDERRSWGHSVSNRQNTRTGHEVVRNKASQQECGAEARGIEDLCAYPSEQDSLKLNTLAYLVFFVA